MIQYVRMTQPETWKNLGPPYVMLDQSNYRATISGNLPDGVFNFLWHVVENPNSKTANITLPKRSHTWNGVRLEDVSKTIIAAYEKEVAPA